MYPEVSRIESQGFLVDINPADGVCGGTGDTRRRGHVPRSLERHAAIQSVNHNIKLDSL